MAEQTAVGSTQTKTIEERLTKRTRKREYGCRKTEMKLVKMKRGLNRFEDLPDWRWTKYIE